MIRFIYFLFTGKKLCDHKWKTIQSYEIEYFSRETEKIPETRKKTWELQCEKCGCIKVARKRIA